VNQQEDDSERPRKGVFHKIGAFLALHEDEEGDEVYEDDPAAAQKRNVVAFSAPAGRKAGSAEVAVFAPKGFSDVTDVADALRARQVVIVNLQGVDRGLLQRVVDFTSGVAYTLDGKIQKLADAMYLVVPPGVPVNSQGIRETLGSDGTLDFMQHRP